MAKLNKGIKGRLRINFKDEYLESIQENKDVFMAVIERDFDEVEYDIYVATFDGTDDYICIDFNIMSSTFKECKSELSHFKREIKNHFGFKPESQFSATYERVR